MPVAERVRGHARERPEAKAVVIGERSLTWRALAENAARLAGGLQALAPRQGAARALCPPGGRLVALLLENDVAFAELFVAATQAPNVCAVLDPKWPPALVDEVLRRLQPDLVVVGSGHEAARLRAAGGPLVLSLGDNSYAAWMAAQMPRDALPECGEDEPFLVTFTSGTTSTPKAIRRSRRSWRASLSTGASFFGLGPERAALAPGSLVHGLTLYALAEQLHAGAAFHGLPRFDAGEALGALRETSAKRLVVVPTMLEGICREAGASGRCADALETIVSAGAKLQDDAIGRAARCFPRARVVEYYGASELGFVTVAQEREGGRDAGVGRPFPGVDLAIASPRGLTRAPGVAGTVMVRSALVCDGYLWGGDAVGFRVEDGWATVGDVGRLDESGALHLLGREGGMILTGGHNVFPGEVEAALLAAPGVENAIVFGLSDAYLGQVVAAAVSGPAAEVGEAGGILAACATMLPRYKLPRRLFAVGEWPLTVSGKIARGAVLDWIEKNDERALPLRP